MKFIKRKAGHAAAALAVGAILGTQAAPTSAAESLARQAVKAPANVEVFIQLDTPSVSELNIQAVEATGELASSDAQKHQAALVDAQQARFRNTLTSLGGKELSTQRVAANGLRARVPASEIENLKNLPGVLSVGRVETHTLDNVTSAPWIGAVRAAQQLGLTGKGVTVGIIDTGIDYTHANFGGPGTVAAYTANDKNVVEPGSFPTAKVVGGHDFAGSDYDANDPDSVPVPDEDPLDGNGHGSHVAGTAAGLGVPGIIGAGVAPDAKLYALKVFGDVAGSTNLTSLAIEWAMDPNGDGDMSDHLDVINMSLGSPLGEPNDPSAISTNHATRVGLIVATSAGNEGDIPYITGAPGVARTAISTAATNPGGRSNDSRVNVTAPAGVAGFKDNIEGAGPVLLQNVGPLSGTLVEAAPLNGCAPLTNAAAVNGNIALIVRGVCGFVNKYLAAQAAGARAIVVFNDGADPTRNFPLAMGGLTAAVTIPGVMISFTDGTAINAVATTAAISPVQVTLDVGVDTTDDDQIASFSSRGPGSTGNSSFKPDLSAPGLAIVSTGVGTGNGSEELQGTSMASPHTAGAAALLRQQFPKLKPAGIKALLQNSSVGAASTQDTSLARQGVGVIRVDEAAKLSSYAAPAGISFGRLNPTNTVNVSEEVELTNLSKAKGQRTFFVTHVPQKTYPGVTVTCPTSVTVGSRSSKDFKVRLHFDPKVTAAAGVFDNTLKSQSEVDGWCVLDDGKDTLRVGYLAVVDAASRMDVDRVSSTVERVGNKGPAIGFAEGFTFVNDQSTRRQRGTYASIAKLGVRRADPALFFDLPVLEFGLLVEEPWEHISNLEVDIFIDADKDGTEDFVLQARDLSSYQDVAVGATYVTAQFPVDGDGFLDWVVNWDFNDQVVVLPFTLGPDFGFVPESFNYRLVLRSRDGDVDEQRGTVDLANEVVPDLNSFGLEAGDSVDITKSRKGRLLWLFPNNAETEQGRECR